jgi:glucose-6-phosphate isomerase
VIVISAVMNLAAASYCGRTRETVTNFAPTVLWRVHQLKLPVRCRFVPLS